jgi:hypothetical protein
MPAKAVARAATALTTIGLLMAAAPVSASAQTSMQCAFDSGAAQMNTPFPPPPPSVPSMPPSGPPAPPSLPAPPQCPPPSASDLPAMPNPSDLGSGFSSGSSSEAKPPKHHKKQKHYKHK